MVVKPEMPNFTEKLSVNSLLVGSKMLQTMTPVEVKEIIKSARKKAGLVQKDVARSLDVTDQMVSLWERGENEPGLKNKNALAELFGAGSWDELVASNDPDREILFSVRRDAGPGLFESVTPDEPLDPATATGADRFARLALDLGQEPREAAERVLSWLMDQNDTIQRGILGVLPPDVTPDLVRLVLESLADPPKPKSKGIAVPTTIIGMDKKKKATKKKPHR